MANSTNSSSRHPVPNLSYSEVCYSRAIQGCIGHSEARVTGGLEFICIGHCTVPSKVRSFRLSIAATLTLQLRTLSPILMSFTWPWSRSLGPVLLDLCSPELNPSLLTAPVSNLPLTDERLERQSDPFWIWGRVLHLEIWHSGWPVFLQRASA